MTGSAQHELAKYQSFIFQPVVNFKELTVDRTANPSLLLLKFLNYKEAIQAFYNHTAGFYTRLMVLYYIY